ncbi:MAG: PEP-CTERM sorting domain-containing protein [Armatimonadetes bacterium]|nr:PEP-CTERM sorting domain-containing protein [Armatimonadota bacterium]MBS1710105.1 PEP-CTERM sorting domain-containing protein [Armatimonadota bacterium]MBX3109995.1 PEP-CTERM sorting domain-containing protein [Fimbriimonadaceae bacterium]
MKTTLVCAGVAALSACAHAGFNFTGFGPSQWGASDATLGVSGYTVEDFEDVNLVSGLQVTIASPNGGYGPSSTIPNTFNPFTDSTFGTAFQFGGGGAWDGSNGLINTRTNREFPYSETGSWGFTTFTFAGGASSVGFSVQQMDLQTTVLINGNPVGLLDVLAGWSVNGQRQGYVRIDAFGGDQINSVTVANGSNGTFSDGLMFDHVAFNPVPEPATMAVCALAGLGLLRRKR